MISSLFTITDYLNMNDADKDVFVLSDIKQGGETDGDTIWLTRGDAEWVARQKWDVLVCNRGAGQGYGDLHAKHRILWTHDLPHTGHAPNPKILKAFHVVFMSEYARNVWTTAFPTIKKNTIIPNGVDKELFYPRHKQLNRLIFCSAPNRGLKRLPLIFEAIQGKTKCRPVMDAYSNMRVLHPNEVRNDEEDGYSLAYKDCKKVGINIQDPIPQEHLAKKLGHAGLMILPSDYPEICSNTILQSLASGTPIVTTGGVGSAPEWIKSHRNGVLTRFQPVDYMVHTMEIVRTTSYILNNPRFHLTLIRNAPKTRNLFTWDEIGAKWAKLVKRLT
jgi:glycosyltransferase involved in cell wall biosynthesis